MRSYLWIILLSLFVGACGDRNADDYQRARVSEEASKMDVVVGAYSGDLLSSADGRMIGKMILELRSSTRVISTSGNPTTSRQAVLKGVVTIEREDRTILPFSDGYFNSDSEELQLTIGLIRRNLDHLDIDLNGAWSEGKITGTIGIANYPERSGIFNLRRTQAETVKAVVLKDPSVTAAGPQPKIWRATEILPSGNTPVDLVIWPHHANDAEKAMEIFSPIQLRDISIMFGGVQNYFAMNRFTNAIWDLRDGRLHGEEEFSESGAVASLDCWAVSLASGEMGWKCDFYQNGVSLPSLLFSPRDKF